jgi:hypothetical protein
LLKEGQLCIEMADPMRLWFGCPVSLDSTGRRLLFDAALMGGGPPASTSATPPSGATAGQLWFDPVGLQLYVFYDSFWVAASSTGALVAAVGALTAEVASLRAQMAELRADRE